MCTKRTALFSATTLLAFGIAFAGNAHAALTDAALTECSDEGGSLGGKVTPNDGCQILEPLGNNDNDSVGGNDPSAWTVNEEKFFDFSDWWFDGKWQAPGDDERELIEDEDDEPTLADFVGDSSSGTWSLNNDVSAFSDLMFVFKDGGNTNLVGYLIDVEFDVTGEYASPFTTPPFDINEEKNISHISIYARREGVQIPAPGILGLMGIGLVGLFAAGSGRRRA